MQGDFVDVNRSSLSRLNELLSGKKESEMTETMIKRRGRPKKVMAVIAEKLPPPNPFNLHTFREAQPQQAEPQLTQKTLGDFADQVPQELVDLALKYKVCQSTES